MNTELLRLCHFSARIGQISYFSDFSFSICAGEIHGLCGLSSAQRDILIRYFPGRKPAASFSLLVSPVRQRLEKCFRPVFSASSCTHPSSIG